MMLNKPDIIEAVSNEGIGLRQRGKSYWGRCPLHEDNTPSFKVDPDKQLFYCFGCGEGGDVIKLVQKLKGYSFKDALTYLGISNGKPPKVNSRDVKKKELLNDFNEWCKVYYIKLCNVSIELQRVKQKAETMKDLDFLAKFYHGEPAWNHHMDILFNGSDKDKFKLYCEVSGHE